MVLLFPGSAKSKGVKDTHTQEPGICEDLKRAGVIDPTKVTRVAVSNAGSIARHGINH